MLAIAVLAVEVLTSERIFKQDKSGSPSFAVPMPQNRYHKENMNGDLIPNFKSPAIPEYTPASDRTPDIGSGD